MRDALTVGALVVMVLVPLGCSQQKEEAPSSADIKVRDRTVLPKTQPKKNNTLNKKVAEVKNVKMAGEKVVVRDVSDSYDTVYDIKKMGILYANLPPNQFAKTSSRPEVFDIKKLLTYQGPSFKQKMIKGGYVFIVYASTELNYRRIDILLSALEIPFVIRVSGGKLKHGKNWPEAGELDVIVNRRNYREAAKLLQAAIKNNALADEPGPRLKSIREGGKSKDDLDKTEGL